MNFSEVEYRAKLKMGQDIWFGVYIGTAIIGTIANILIFWIIVAHKTMRTKLNTCIGNMVMSDLIVSLGSVSLEGYQQIYKTWIFGSVACTLQEFIESIGRCVFILALISATIERYFAIIPISKRDDMDTRTMTTLDIWGSSIILSAPNWIFATLFIHSTDGGTILTSACVQIWPDAETGDSLRQIYKMFFMFLTYVLPLVYMSYRFGRLSVNIWVTKDWPTSDENKQSVKMVIVVVILYAISSVPLRLCFIFEETCNTIIKTQANSDSFITAAVWFELANVVLNPIVFICMDKRFRLGFKKAFRCFPFIHYNPDNILEVAAAEPIQKIELYSM